MKKSNLNKPTRMGGFTIIEVMIVIAVAGLIMILVLVAAPTLQRNQRNSARKDVVNRVKTEIDDYASNNLGGIPSADANGKTGFNSAAGGFYKNYISPSANSYNDPQTGNATFASKTSWTAAAKGTIEYFPGFYCTGGSGSSAPAAATDITAGSTRNYAVTTLLEGGSSLYYCVDNQ